MLELMSFPNESTIFFSIVSTKLGNIKSSALNYHVEIVILLIVVVILFRRFVQVGKLIDAQYPYVLELERKLACFYKSDLCFAREKKYSWQGDGFLSIWDNYIYSRMISIVSGGVCVVPALIKLKSGDLNLMQIYPLVVYVATLIYFNRTRISVWIRLKLNRTK